MALIYSVLFVLCQVTLITKLKLYQTEMGAGDLISCTQLALVPNAQRRALPAKLVMTVGLERDSHVGNQIPSQIFRLLVWPISMMIRSKLNNVGFMAILPYYISMRNYGVGLG